MHANFSFFFSKKPFFFSFGKRRSWRSQRHLPIVFLIPSSFCSFFWSLSIFHFFNFFHFFLQKSWKKLKNRNFCKDVKNHANFLVKSFRTTNQALRLSKYSQKKYFCQKKLLPSWVCLFPRAIFDEIF